MTRLLFLRHGPTQWNREGRLQGQIDTPLLPAVEPEIARWRVPQPFASAPCYASALTRARRTAELLGRIPETDARLNEMAYGDWEGRIAAEVREGPDIIEGHMGLDFRPPGGESPREVQRRLAAFMADRAAEGGDFLVVAHKQVIRCLYALASGWAMDRDPDDRLDFAAAQLFGVGADGRPVVLGLNLPLDGGAAVP